MAFSSDHLAPFLKALTNANHCYIGYSGGLDSHVLLYALRKIVAKKSLTAVHINHQLSPFSDKWAQHCQIVCDELGIPLIIKTVCVESAGGGLEEAARHARYQVFESLLGQDDLLLLAHHRDDQVETILYRLLRGAGPGGLSGIPEHRPLGKGSLLRPLLDISRQALHEYAKAEGLSWIEDESNTDFKFDRNFIRHRIVAPIAERWPDYGERLSHSAALCNEANNVLRELAHSDLQALKPKPERVGSSIDLAPLLTLSRERQAHLLRYWIHLQHYPVPGHRVIQTLQEQMTHASHDSSMQVKWSNCCVRKYRDKLYLLPGWLDDTHTPNKALRWRLESPLTLPDGAVLSASPAVGSGLKIPLGNKLEVTFRKGGERCTPAARAGSNTLKTLFQEYGLEPWLRQRVPLIYCDGELAAVGDLWVCKPFAAGARESGYQLAWHYLQGTSVFHT